MVELAMRWSNVLFSLGIGKSKKDIQRLVKQGAIDILVEYYPNDVWVTLKSDSIPEKMTSSPKFVRLRVGKHNFYSLLISFDKIYINHFSYRACAAVKEYVSPITPEDGLEIKDLAEEIK